MPISTKAIKQAIKHLGLEKSFEYVLVGGTNGKGSTVAMLSYGYRELGYKVVSTQSPHIFEPQERVLFNGTRISKKKYEKYMEEMENLPFKLSFFEKVSLMAFLYAVEKGADIVVGEVGLGGLNDAMNVFPKDLVVITSLGHDHMKYFGTWKNLMKEKFALLKDAKKYIGIYSVELEKYAIEKRVFGIHYGPKNYFLTKDGTFVDGSFTSLVGVSQIINLSHVNEVFRGEVKEFLVRLPGRMEFFQCGIIDGAHNPEALHLLLKTLEILKIDLPVVFSVKRTKLWKEMLDMVEDPLIYPKQLSPSHISPNELLSYKGSLWGGERALFVGTFSLLHEKHSIDKYCND